MTVGTAFTATSSLSTSSRMQSLLAATMLGITLFSSGAAALVNQVIWQRSLKVFLGGSETTSSMVVVLVFMGGLGVGSLWMGYRAGRVLRPLRALGVIELMLAVVNLLICGVLTIGISSNVYELQQLALSLHVPLILVYAVMSLLILSIPCFLMGATMPLSAAACQRVLNFRDSRMIGRLFFINTIGSVLGAIVASGYMLPYLGQSRSLVIASLMNVIAGFCALVLMGLRIRLANPGSETDAVVSNVSQQSSCEKPWTLWRPSWNEVLSLGLGFCSLGYEMYLFRLIPLTHEPLPYTFSAVLSGFLLYWSIGAALSSSRWQVTMSTGLRLCGLAVVASIPMFTLDRLMVVNGVTSLCWFIVLRSPYFIPCLCFGYLFGLVSRRAARDWGNDIGRLYAWNTIGSCLGIVLVTFIGYQLPFYLLALVLGLFIFGLQEYECKKSSSEGRSWMRGLIPISGAGALCLFGCYTDLSQLLPTFRMYSGRDGVIVIQKNGDVVWDGLWHSALSENGSHIGTNNWYMAACPVLSHATGDIRDVCVIGLGTGITASALADLSSVERVDAYDITQVLKDVFRDYPDETLGVAENSKINIIWQDARTGLAINSQRYDLIQAQPLYLKQAGSALLNSKEFYEIVRERLKPNGLFCLYSNGSAEQAFVVRETADQVFDYRESFLNGYLLILSNDPIPTSVEHFANRLTLDDPLMNQIRHWKTTSSCSEIINLLDHPRLPSGDGTWVITDDYPVVEYREHLSRQMRAGGQIAMPTPKAAKN